MSARLPALLVVSALAAAACTSPPPTSHYASPADFLLLDGTEIGDVTEGSSMVRARIVQTDDPTIHALLASRAEATDDVFAAMGSSAGTRIVNAPQVVLLPGQESNVSVGETIRFAQTSPPPCP